MLDSSSPWRRDLAALLRLTGPVAAARLGVMAMGLTDALVVGRYSAEQLGYQALGWTLPAVAMVGAMGFLSGVQVMTARYLGQGRPDLTGGVFRRGLAYALALGLGMGALLIALGPAVLHAFRLAPGLADGASAPMRVFAASLPAILVASCAGQFLEASGKAGVSMAVMWIANLVNLGLDLLLVPGTLGLPALGAVGSGWATFGARAFLAAALLAHILRMKSARSLGLFDRVSDGPAAAAEQRRLGYGAGVSQLVESAAFSGMNLVVGAISALTVAGWAVVLNLTAIVFMTPLGMSTACAVLVGRAYGARDEAGVRRAAILGFCLAAAYGVVVAALVIPLRWAIAGAYTTDPALLATAGAALGLAALFFCPDAVQVVAAQALRARGDVLAPTLTHIASYALVMLPLGWLLAVRLHHGLNGAVLAVILASLMSAGLLLGRFGMLDRPPKPPRT
ncbi:MAG TPA: MATE family efflux transporter [Caulobacteraceae bacterium]|jgi:MATE family multidrug resistance protein